ncbi:MAG: peptidase domain-containing ABC transporter [Pseudomonadota bacterium]
MKLILQTETSECGLACLAMVASHFEYHIDLSDLRRRFSTSLKGMTLGQLMRHAAALELSTRPLALELAEIPQLRLPCVLHWDMNHFVVLKATKKSLLGKLSYIVFDPAIGERTMTAQEMAQHFTGVALEIAPSGNFKEQKASKRISIAELTGKVLGVRRAIAQVLVLALTLEIFAIVAPLFNQFVIDEVVVSGDRELLKILVLGFGLLLVTQTSIGLARSWFLMRWSIDVGFQWTNRVFAHLIRLPVAFFEKRHVGDVVSRFGSIGAIQDTLTSLFVESALDGLMAVLALVMMFVYSVKLSVVVIISLLLYVAVRWIFYAPLREAAQERLILAAKESSNFLETMRAVTPLKLFGRESERSARWQNLKLDVINRDVKTQKLGILFKISNTTISAVQGLVIFYIGAGLVMENSLTVGMLFAFSSYSGTFSGRVFSLIDLFIKLKMLGMHVDRLSDIVLEPVEDEVSVETDLRHIESCITLRKVRFRYADGEPWILDGVDLHIPAGESLALVGASGCGKTTLCKIILGLLSPTEGDVLVGHIPVRQIGLRRYRELVGTVMQDDVLLAGSLLENISFFDAKIDTERAEQCAKAAAIHGEIVAMPMGYQSLVGDMGSSLSGGQKQRVLLARALYKQPRILALDEATSHLDVDNEQRVNAALGQLDLTRIMVAHRPETIAAAGRVLEMCNGKLVERGAANDETERERECA